MISPEEKTERKKERMIERVGKRDRYIYIYIHIYTYIYIYIDMRYRENECMIERERVNLPPI